MLDRLVNRQHQAVSILCLYLLFIIKRHLRPVCILRRYQPAGCSRQAFIILVFYAGKALVVAACKPDQRRSKRSIWIVPFIVLNQVDYTGNIVFFVQLIYKFQDFVSDVAFNLPLHYHIIRPFLCFLKNIRLLQIQYLC